MKHNPDPMLPGLAEHLPPDEPPARQELRCPYHGPQMASPGDTCGRQRRVVPVDGRGYLRLPIPADADWDTAEGPSGWRQMQEAHLPLDFARCGLMLTAEKNELWSRVWVAAVALARPG
ncbi:hypothetical protein [Candidatus Poriferisodalis sp.]|uniref:hypothetical protein n=1 Tax=Candidatus Poriferisodalis sp. TaxID=3101277 RepID=UPI003D0D98E9